MKTISHQGVQSRASLFSDSLQNVLHLSLQDSHPRAATCLGKLQTERSKCKMQINQELMLRSGTKNFLSSKFSGKLWRLSHLLCAYRWPRRLTWKMKVIITATYLDKCQQYFVLFQKTFRDYIFEHHILWGWVSLWRHMRQRQDFKAFRLFLCKAQ